MINNTFFQPQNWVIRILQETTEPGFLPCRDNEFRNNIVFLSQDLTEVNIGPNTDPQSFVFTNNLWYNASANNWTPSLPVLDSNQVIADPGFANIASEDFSIPHSSPAVLAGKSLSQPTLDFVQHSYFDPPSIGAFEGNSEITSSEYLVQDDGILVGPNPSNGTVTIDGNLGSAFVQVINNQGQLVEDFSSSGTPLTINLTELPSGVYFLKILSKAHPQMSLVRVIKM